MRTRLRDIRVPRAPWIAATLAVAAWIVFLILGRHVGFFSDEYSFLVYRRSPSWNTWMAPHNGHWSLVPVIIFQILYHSAGLRSYWPYLAVVLAFHSAAGYLLFVAVRQRGGDVLALAAATFLLFLAAGSENIFWAFQIGFVGSVVFGLEAMIVLGRRTITRRAGVGAAALLLLSVMFSGNGLIFIIAVGVELLLDRARSRRLIVLAPPALVYAVWWVAYRHGQGAGLLPLNAAGLRTGRMFLVRGIESAASGLMTSTPRAWPVLVLVCVAVGATVVQRRADPRAVGAAVALLMQYALIALARSGLGLAFAGASRYVYIGDVFILIGLGTALGGIRGGTPAALVVVGVVVFLIVHTSTGFRRTVAFRAERTAASYADLQAVALFGRSAAADPNVLVDPHVVPDVTATRYFALVRDLGSPVSPATVEALEHERDAAVAESVGGVLERLFARRFGVQPAPGASPPAACRTVSGSADIGVPDGGALWVRSQAPVRAAFVLWFEGRPHGFALADIAVRSGIPYLVRAPASGIQIEWRVRVTLPFGGSLTACASPG